MFLNWRFEELHYFIGVGPGGHGVEPPVRECGKLDTGGLGIRLGKVRLA